MTEHPLRYIEDELGIREHSKDDALRSARVVAAIRALIDTNNRFLVANNELRQLHRKFCEALDRTRWSWHDDNGRYCLYCKARFVDGHTADCPIVVLLNDPRDAMAPRLPPGDLEYEEPSTQALQWCIENSSLYTYANDAREELYKLHSLAVSSLRVWQIMREMEGEDE